MHCGLDIACLHRHFFPLFLDGIQDAMHLTRCELDCAIYFFSKMHAVPSARRRRIVHAASSCLEEGSSLNNSSLLSSRRGASVLLNTDGTQHLTSISDRSTRILSLPSHAISGKHPGNLRCLASSIRSSVLDQTNTWNGCQGKRRERGKLGRQKTDFTRGRNQNTCLGHDSSRARGTLSSLCS